MSRRNTGCPAVINEGANVMSTSDHTSNGVEALQRFYQAVGVRADWR